MIGKQNDKSELITTNRQMVELVAKQYLNQGLSLEQLIREGDKGLAYAAEHCDTNKGCIFPYYASWLVRMSILQALSAVTHGVPIPPVFVPKRQG